MKALRSCLALKNRAAHTPLPVQLAVALLTCAILQATLFYLPQIKLWPFACGSAHLAAGFLGCPVEPVQGGWQLLSTPIGNRVHEGCSGYNYFTLLCMTGAFLIWGRAGWSWRRKTCLLAAGLPIAVGIGILVNTARILCAFQVRVHTTGLLPPNLQPAAHLVTGLSVTICTLAAFIWLWKHHERKHI